MHLVARATDVVTKYPTMHRTAPTKRNYLAPNFNSVEGEMYFSISITCLPSLWPSKLTHGSGTDLATRSLTAEFETEAAGGHGETRA